MTRRFFAGCITPAGFTDFFHHIMPIQKAQRRYFIKGASGSGKSTFITKIAKNVASHNIDFFHCSNDASSIDGIQVPSLGFSIIDATSPHAHDPAIPGGIDKIIDFGNFLDAKQVSKYIGEIIELTSIKKRLYAEAQILISNTCTVIELENNRNLFLSAITPDGFKSFKDITLAGYKVYDAPSQAFLQTQRETALKQNIATESLCNPLNPQELECLIIPSQSVAYYDSSPSNLVEEKQVEQAIALMYKARATHYLIEEIYINAMDFSHMDELAQKVIDEI